MKTNNDMIEVRAGHAFTIMATMLLTSSVVCLFAAEIPEYMLRTAAGVLIGSTFGAILCVVITFACICNRGEGDETS